MEYKKLRPFLISSLRDNETVKLNYRNNQLYMIRAIKKDATLSTNRECCSFSFCCIKLTPYKNSSGSEN